MPSPGNGSRRDRNTPVNKILARMDRSWLHSRRNSKVDYQYKPLEDPMKETRIVILQPGRFDDEIRLSLGTRRLKASHPDYEALSYVWGYQDDPSHARVVEDDILRNEGILPIGRNLDTAIRYLRYEHEKRYFWIDALCINQQDTTERSQQVSLMAKIYSKATAVTIWLGPEEDDSDKALETLQFLSQKVGLSSDGDSLRQLPHINEPRWADLNIPLPFKNGELNPVAALFGRPYFRRTWVRQEVAHAAKAVVRVGRTDLPWEIFRVGAICIATKPLLPSSTTGDHIKDFRDSALPTVSVFCRRSNAHLSFSYSSIKEYLQNTTCSDPRDRIYASLSLLSWEDRRLGIIPDYAITAEELYVNIALRYYATKQTLELLESCELSTRSLDIPSWVPDFTSTSASAIQIQSTWSACAWISAQCIYMDNTSIRVAGVATSKVEKVFHLGHNENGWDSDWGYKALDAVYNLKQQGINFATRFATEQSYLEACCRTFICNNFDDSYEPPQLEIQPNVLDCIKGLELLWSADESWKEEFEPSQFLSHRYRSIYRKNFVGRSFFWAGGTLMGLAPANTREGDVICVLLGCRRPIVLRPITSSGPTPEWQVIGPCYAHGLMNGEAIYGKDFPSTLCTVQKDDIEEKDWIDSYSFQLSDKNDRENCWNDPAEILTELAGIKVEKYERYPHRLEVLPETLRDAGVALEEFTLV